MAPHTTGGLTSGMARGGDIHHENYGFIGAKGPTLMSTFSRSPDFNLGNLDTVAHDGHTPRTLEILEYTYI